ncbi:type IV pilus assembly PilZ [Oleidesulfovibrio alaskensis G20]|jgi:hypothetical protein|uniref:Type IV pilus assembly PilZ n=1 Tax=Oleidesulfovibrio alaskensis (strain ATCC BAA-1058 / DSM 17464 / G20) TaxID=207559 RepID=Q316Z2_OLEA2|nr:PilZ domain-containing protein [Oleidesulfovibrio alaskensis]ABB37004.1 type IV pilus assembly PilZ [Oleidesulfovibrio alaskensis G20]MBG0773047.1 PilZ domain-containing protein [Oleidesulfovibrio alaskensis]MBL3582821.1 PilZ domain-containing protein [Oleidesulfovibrio alaskensis]
MTHQEEKRRFTRLPKGFSIEASILQFPFSSQRRVTSNCADIGGGGVSFESPARFEPGDKLQLKVHIPTLNKYSPGFFKVYENDAEQYLQAIGEVAWVDRNGAGYTTGVKFIDIDPDVCKALCGLVEKTLRDQEK